MLVPTFQALCVAKINHISWYYKWPSEGLMLRANLRMAVGDKGGEWQNNVSFSPDLKSLKKGPSPCCKLDAKHICLTLKPNS